MASSSTSCPYCKRPVRSHSRVCEHCGVDLALAAVLAENALTSSEVPSGAPVSPEILVPRLGEYLIAKGLLSPAQLKQALDYQQEQARQGRPILVGQALLELKLINRENLDQAVTEQISELQSALRQANRRLEQRVRERTQELQDALNRLAELNQLKSNFISTISHELRTPLTHIKGYVELMAEEGLGPLTEDQIHALEVMQRSSGRLENLINDLIHFSMASKGEFTLRMDAISIESAARAAVTKALQKAKEQQIHLQAQVPADLPPVQADAEKITWVMVQLLDNAVKFTQPGGKVSFTIEAHTERVHVSVEDTGIGIPADRLNEIFEPFHQLDSSATRKYGGAGLGLALVKRILEAHGTLPRISSEVGAGTRIEFDLPVAIEDFRRSLPIGQRRSG